jgi:hypothetical protein
MGTETETNAFIYDRKRSEVANICVAEEDPLLVCKSPFHEPRLLSTEIRE